MTSHYDDPKFSYLEYWNSRDYEHLAEVIAINRLIKSKKFPVSVDLGGGYGRLTSILTKYSDRTTLIEPSAKQRKIARNYLKKFPKVDILSGTAEKTNLPDNCTDLVLVVRVIHHLPDPEPAFQEIYRILKPGGILLLEFANSVNIKACIRSFFSGHPILLTPIERRSKSNIKHQTIPFVNHHPQAIIRQLNKVGFSIFQTLSVSNFRSPLLKHLFPLSIILFVEKISQKILCLFYFGPSIFILARKS
jgi:ubiquinone/menaquinone biosynthesis C-methylase UbiE